MTTATDTCPGCCQKFAPRGFLNHLQLSHDPRCTSAWDRLQPTRFNTLEQEPPHPSPVADIEMVDLGDTEPIIPFRKSNQIGATNADTDMSNYEDNSIYPRSISEEVPNVVLRPSNPQVLVVFDSDAEDSDNDNDGNQDWTPHPASEIPPGPRSITDQTGKFIYTV